MRCNGYADPQFFMPDGTMRRDREPAQVFDTVEEYVSWINRDRNDGWLFVAPDQIKTVDDLARCLDAECERNLEKDRRCA